MKLWESLDNKKDFGEVVTFSRLSFPICAGGLAGCDYKGLFFLTYQAAVHKFRVELSWTPRVHCQADTGFPLLIFSPTLLSCLCLPRSTQRKTESLAPKSHNCGVFPTPTLLSGHRGESDPLQALL